MRAADRAGDAPRAGRAGAPTERALVLADEATDLGELAWTGTQKFFGTFAPPSPDFSPATSETPETAIYDAEARSDLERAEFPHLFAWLDLAKRQKKRRR